MLARAPLALTLTLLVTSGALWAKDPAPPAAPEARREIKGFPALLSPQGERVLYAKRVKRADGSKAFAYFVSELEGEVAERQVVEVDVSSDDYLAYLNNGGARQWSPDGTRFGYATTGEGGRYVCGIATIEGRTNLFEAAQDTRSLCFAPEGGGGWFLEGSMKGKPMGFKIRAFSPEGEPGAAICEDAEKVALGLEPSPDGKRLAFLFGDRQAIRIGILTLADKRLIESEPVKTDDHFLKPRLLWTPDSSALVITTRGEAGKWPANVIRCEATSGAVKVLLSESRWAVTGVLKSGQVCLYNRSEEKVALLDPTDGLLREVTWPVVVLQQAGERSLVYKLEPRGFWVD